jgi:hypothetical protein
LAQKEKARRLALLSQFPRPYPSIPACFRLPEALFSLTGRQRLCSAPEGHSSQDLDRDEYEGPSLMATASFLCREFYPIRDGLSSICSQPALNFCTGRHNEIGIPGALGPDRPSSGQGLCFSSRLD